MIGFYHSSMYHLLNSNYFNMCDVAVPLSDINLTLVIRDEAYLLLNQLIRLFPRRNIQDIVESGFGISIGKGRTLNKKITVPCDISDRTAKCVVCFAQYVQ